MADVVAATRRSDRVSDRLRLTRAGFLGPGPCSTGGGVQTCPPPNAGIANYTARLLDLESPFELPTLRMTAQAPGILVVDDEAEIRAMVTDFLTSQGYLVLPANDGAEALTVLDHARVSLTLLDMRMPNLDGWGFARALRERRCWLPIVVMSAAVSAQQWADDIGAAGCVSKPFDLLDLLAQVERLVAPH